MENESIVLYFLRYNYFILSWQPFIRIFPLAESPKHDLTEGLESLKYPMNGFGAQQMQVLDAENTFLVIYLSDSNISSLMYNLTCTAGPSLQEFEWTQFGHCVVGHCMDMWETTQALPCILQKCNYNSGKHPLLNQKENAGGEVLTLNA